MKKTILTIAAMLIAALCHAQYFIIQTPESLALRAIKDPAELQAKLDDLAASGSDQDYNTLHTYYQSKDRNKADSIAKVATEKFPKGSVALKNVAGPVMFEKDPVKIEEMLSALRKEYPGQDFNTIYKIVIPNLLNAKDATAALKYQKLTTGKTKSEMLSRTIGTASIIDNKLAVAFVADELAKKNNSDEDRMTLLFLQSKVLTKAGDFQKAFQSIKTYYNALQRPKPEEEAVYYTAMSKIGRYAEAFPHLEKAVKTMVGGKDIKDELKVAYAKLNPGKDVGTYMAGLEEKVGDFQLNEIAKTMIKEKSPAFAVLDANGKTVSLADFKGKTIVIDFWATWCGPCKMSLPGMQATVNKYKNDPNVAFLFIHTWEGKGKDADPTAAAKKYFAENNYNNLPLYMDLQNAAKVNPAVSAFKVTGIPTKFVIDGNGDIRFVKVGGSFNVEEAVTELSGMIELSRKNLSK